MLKVLMLPKMNWKRLWIFLSNPIDTSGAEPKSHEVLFSQVSLVRVRPSLLEPLRVNQMSHSSNAPPPTLLKCLSVWVPKGSAISLKLLAKTSHVLCSLMRLTPLVSQPMMNANKLLTSFLLRWTALTMILVLWLSQPLTEWIFLMRLFFVQVALIVRFKWLSQVSEDARRFWVSMLATRSWLKMLILKALPDKQLASPVPTSRTFSMSVRSVPFVMVMVSSLTKLWKMSISALSWVPRVIQSSPRERKNLLLTTKLDMLSLARFYQTMTLFVKYLLSLVAMPVG